MVDIGDIDDSDDTTTSTKSDTDTQEVSPAAQEKAPDDVPDPYTQTVAESPTPGESQVADVSVEWKKEHSDLNYRPERGEAEAEYVSRQVKECTEFYDNYLEIARSNMAEVQRFALYHHTLGMALAEMVVGIKAVLRDQFNYSERKAHTKALKICEKGGQSDAMEELVSMVAKRLEEQ